MLSWGPTVRLCTDLICRHSSSSKVRSIPGIHWVHANNFTAGRCSLGAYLDMYCPLSRGYRQLPRLRSRNRSEVSLFQTWASLQSARNLEMQVTLCQHESSSLCVPGCTHIPFRPQFIAHGWSVRSKPPTECKCRRRDGSRTARVGADRCRNPSSYGRTWEARGTVFVPSRPGLGRSG